MALPVAAGLLDTGTPYQGWRGSSDFQEGTLKGRVDWAVFSSGSFPFAGYAPTYDYTYVYQVVNSGTASISAFSVALDGDAYDAGSFVDVSNGVDGIAPIDAFIEPPPGSANWNFEGIIAGDSSCGLVFSSPWSPMSYYSLVVDDGQVANYIQVASPMAGPIPEPSTLCLLAAGLGLALATRRLRRRR